MDFLCFLCRADMLDPRAPPPLTILFTVSDVLVLFETHTGSELPA